MARLTYAALALALASLIAGFFVRTTAIPLFASIGLSALVLILILRGWARRMRLTEEGEEGEAPEEIEVLEDIDSAELVVVDPGTEREERRTRAERRARARPVATDVIEERPPRARPERIERPPRPARAGRRAPSRVVVLPGRSRYHTPDCRFAHGKGAEEIAESTARRRRLRPCSVCLGG